MSPTPYDDLLSYPYRGITSHPPMPLADRAAQFFPFRRFERDMTT